MSSILSIQPPQLTNRKKKTKFEENYNRCDAYYCMIFACVLVKFKLSLFLAFFVVFILSLLPAL